MGYGDKDQEICTTENIPLFVLYLKGKLSREQQLKVDRHVQECTDCRMNFAYVEEIINCRQTLSIDEKTLLLKYISDPLWYQSINDAKKHLREEILGDVKELLKESYTDLTKVNSNINNKNLSSTSAPTTANKDNKLSPKLLPQRSFLLLAVALVLVFFSLSTSIYLVINKQHSSFNIPLTISPTTNTPALNTSNTPANNSLYQQLDSLIDQYLESKDSLYLQQAKQMANGIEDKYGDRYGVDLVSYYKSVSLSAIKQLSACRKEMFDLLNQPPGDNYEKRLNHSKKLEQDLFQLDNKIEAYRVKTITNKLYTLLHNYESSNLNTQEGLQFSTNNQYLFLQGYFLLWQAKQLSETSSFEESEKVFQQTISLGKKINLDDLIISANMSLATLYHLNDDDQKCLDTAQSLLSNPEKIKKDRILSLMQIAGLAAANLKYDNLSAQYLKESLRIGEELKNPGAIARSYMFLSLTLAESGNFLDSNQYHLKATQKANELKDDHGRLSALSLALGYYAKTKLLEKDFPEAAKAYTQSLTIIKELKVQNNLQLSQINEGLAIAYKELRNYKEANQCLATANYYGQLAKDKKEKTNCLLSFIPTNCYIK